MKAGTCVKSLTALNKCQSARPSPSEAASVCERCSEQHAHSEGSALIFFPWITRLDRLGCLHEFDCFLSMLAVHTDLRHTHQNSKCPHAAVDVFEERQL